MELEATFGYLYWQEDKRRKEAPPGVAVERSVPRAARGRDRDLLFVHFTLASRLSPPGALYRDLVGALGAAYYSSSGSVTAALRQAVRAANEHLMAYNLQVEGLNKQQGSLTCAVLRDEELFLAQAGTALGFVTHQGEIERLPPAPPGHAIPLGVGYGVDTRFYHSWVTPGDVLLLAEPAFVSQPDSAIAGAVTYQGVETGLKKLEQLCQESGVRQARLLFVEFSAAVAPVAETYTAGRSHQPAEQAPSVGAARRCELTRAPTPDVRTASASRSDEGDLAPAPAPSGAVVYEVDSTAPSVDVERRARRAASGIARRAARLAGGASRLVERLTEPSAPAGQAVPRDHGPSPMTLGLLAVLIPVLVALVAVAVYWQRGQMSQFQDLVRLMESESDLAIAGGREDARPHWDEVIRVADQALLIRPGNSAVQQYRDQALGKLDVLNEVTRLAVNTLYQYQSAGRLSALAVNSLNIFALDTGFDYVYRHRLADPRGPLDDRSPETVLFKTQGVGGRAVGELVDLAWYAKSGQNRADTVAMLDSSGILLMYQPSLGTLLSIELSLPPAWETPIASAVYGDNYYVLDTGARQIWRFGPRQEGGPGEAQPYPFRDNQDSDPFNDVDLSQMVDLAIDRDGNLYLLHSAGQVLKFFGGERKPFALTDLREPLVAPAAVYCSVSGLNPFFYIADPGSARVVQTTQQGLFVAQYQARRTGDTDPFAEITDVFVQETPDFILYATAGDRLLVAHLD